MKQSSTAPSRFLLRLPLLATAALVLLPLSVILLSWGSAQVDVWQHLIETGLGRLLRNTVTLLLGVGTGVILLGVGLAWLTAMCEFPGRRWLDWALMLPLAIPAYVVAFVVLGLFDYAGPVQTQWREWFGRDAWFPNARGSGAVILVMTAVLYPYVYMLARGAFLAQGRATLEAARSLGCSDWGGFLRVALPMARPAIVAGAALALMEVLADFGAVAIFNFDTFTTAIYKAWFGFFNLTAAAQLASLLLLFVGVSLFAETRARGRARYHQQSRRDRGAFQLSGLKAFAASGACLLVFGLAFVLPVVQLGLWAWQRRGDLDARFAELVGNSFGLAGSAALIAASLALLVALAERWRGGRRDSVALRIAGMGYALPGSVLAVGIMLAFAWIDRNWVNPLRALFGLEPTQLLVGSAAALLAAYLIRFYSVAFGPLSTSLERIRPVLHEAAQTLGAGHRRIVRRVYLPLMLPGILTALLLVFVDTLKEMPATLLLRPFGWDTLAVRIYELTSEGEWERAALPALTLVLVGLVPVILLMRRSRR
ncbi:ABC transporter permease [Biformimicrobium ophioploci]|uniref:Iron ABC transporter permease n=1 Tax=Biformimicrobium ophioploci TaxID=3036711 RepID=A0ABQ6M0K7_9GAMM|nr:iron ABC transporter permease [Microbulbifer sp. NKW57]GMG87841.1 iron ABC transporter permease [Microbulbifer sp. NKW57]